MGGIAALDGDVCCYHSGSFPPFAFLLRTGQALDPHVLPVFAAMPAVMDTGRVGEVDAVALVLVVVVVVLVVGVVFSLAVVDAALAAAASC